MRPSWIPALLSVVLAAPALSEPIPPNSTTPSCISLVGSNGGVPAAVGTFTVVVRDLANNPVANAAVVIDLGPCVDLHVCADQLDPAATVNCKTVRKFTAADG